MVGLALGWALAGEPLSAPVLAACLLTVLGAACVMRPARPDA